MFKVKGVLQHGFCTLRVFELGKWGLEAPYSIRWGRDLNCLLYRDLGVSIAICERRSEL